MKKATYFAFFGLFAASAVAMGLVASQGIDGYANVFTKASAQALTLNSENAPSIVAGEGNLTYNEFAHFTYTNASSASGKHVVLNEGGIMRKTEASNNLSSVTATFEGTLYLEVSYGDDFGGAEVYTLTSGTPQEVQGNYWKLTAGEDDTAIESVVLNYGCDAPAQGYTIGAFTLRASGSKMYLDIRVSFAGYTEEEFRGLGWKFDLTRNGALVEDWIWTTYCVDSSVGTKFVISGDVATYSADITDVPNYGYVIHFGPSNTESAPDYKPLRSFVGNQFRHLESDKRFTVGCYVEAGNDGLKYWGCSYLLIDNVWDGIGLTSVTPSSAGIEEISGEVYYVVNGAYEGNVGLDELQYCYGINFQHNSNIDGQGWVYIETGRAARKINFDKTKSSASDGSFTVKYLIDYESFSGFLPGSGTFVFSAHSVFKGAEVDNLKVTNNGGSANVGGYAFGMRCDGNTWTICSLTVTKQ